MRVEFTPDVSDRLDELETALYERGYFSYPESSHRYVEKLAREIHANLPAHPHRPAPTRFGKGMYYAAFRRNRATTWYALFTRHVDADGLTVLIVRRIVNNHTDAHYL